MVTETDRNKANQMKKAHIHGLSSHIYYVLINLMANDQSAGIYIPLLNLNDMIKKKSRGSERKHIYVMHYAMYFYV